jgi:hypothetical protein
MFVPLAPDTPPQATPAVMLAKTSPEQQSAMRPEHIIGICELVDNREFRGEDGAIYPNSYVITPVWNAYSYIQEYEHRKDVSDEDINAAKITVLQQPKHGTLIYEAESTTSGDYRYSPNMGYVGKDSASVLVEIKGVNIKVVYFFHVLNSSIIHRWDEECGKKGGQWKISLAPDADTNLATASGQLPSWLSATQLDGKLASASLANVNLAPLPGTSLAQTTGQSPNASITLDDNAAGHGWFIDYTPYLNEEFLPTSKPNEWVAKADSEAAGKMDMLSVLLHEYGHALGLEHSADSHDFMAATLQPGLRRLPSADEMALMARLAGELRLAQSGNPDGTRADASTDTTTGNPLAPNLLSLLGLLPVGLVRRVGAEDNGTGTTVDAVYRLSAANPAFTNGSFTSAVGWDTVGSVAIGNGTAVLNEISATQTELSQTFIIGQNDRALSFTVNGLSLHQSKGDQFGPGDAFEVALLDANTLVPLTTTIGLSRSDAFLNIQADGAERSAGGLRRSDNADGSKTYTLDVSGIAAGAAVTLSFDLLGFGADDSSITLSNIHLQDVALQTRDDQATLAEDNPAALAVLANDTFVQGAGFMPVVVAAPAHGAVTVNPNGTLAYTPNQDYFGPDAFTYKLSDGLAESNIATVSLTITPVNDAPQGASATLTTLEDTPRILKAGDFGFSDPNDTPANGFQAVILDSLPTAGKLILNDTAIITGAVIQVSDLDANALVFTPAPNANGDHYAQLTFRVQDNGGTTNGGVDTALTPKTLTFNVTPVNDAPELAPLATVQANEGETVIVQPVASDRDGSDVLTYRLEAAPDGAALDSTTGRIVWKASDGDADYGFTVRVTDAGGLAAVQSFTVQVANVVPTLTVGGYTQTYTGAPYGLELSSFDPGQDTITAWRIDWGDGQVQAVAGNPPTVTHVYTDFLGQAQILTQATDEDGVYPLAPFTLNVLAAPLQVTGFGFNCNGFAVRFNEAFDPTVINLYDSALAGLGSADVTLTGATAGAVRGSLLPDADHQGFRFLKSGTPLAPDQYTVTLKSGATAFHSNGGALDGNGDSLPGDDFVAAFTILQPGTVRLSLPDFLRGPGQTVNVPAATGQGIPLPLTSAGDIQSLSFVVKYDPALLNITGVNAGSGLPEGTTFTANTNQPGQLTVHLQAPNPLPAGTLNLFNLVAEVPLTAPYFARQILDIDQVVVNGVAVQCADDDALHVVGYLGDTNGSQGYEKEDVTLIQRVVVKADSGFAAWDDLDPLMIADIDGNGLISSLDATRVYQELSGLDRPEIPPLPTPEALTAARTTATAPATVTALPTRDATDSSVSAATPTTATTATPVSASTAPPSDRETAVAALPATGSDSTADVTGQPANSASSKPADTPAAPVRLDLSGRYTGFSCPTDRRPAKTDWQQAFVTHLVTPPAIPAGPNAVLRITLPPRLETTRQEKAIIS